jgi:hypothetical protein
MARQAVGERRTRQLSRLAGVEFERILVRGGSNHWALFRTPNDRHGRVLMVPPYAVRWTGYGTDHWDSCNVDYSRLRSTVLDVYLPRWANRRLDQAFRPVF